MLPTPVSNRKLQKMKNEFEVPAVGKTEKRYDPQSPKEGRTPTVSIRKFSLQKRSDHEADQAAGDEKPGLARCQMPRLGDVMNDVGWISNVS